MNANLKKYVVKYKWFVLVLFMGIFLNDMLVKETDLVINRLSNQTYRAVILSVYPKKLGFWDIYTIKAKYRDDFYILSNWVELKSIVKFTQPKYQLKDYEVTETDSTIQVKISDTTLVYHIWNKTWSRKDAKN